MLKSAQPPVQVSSLSRGVPVEFIPYDSPAKLADDAALDKWDVAMIGADPARAAQPGMSVISDKVIVRAEPCSLQLQVAVRYVDFTAPYCQIEATYAVASDSKLTQCSAA